MSDEPSSLVLFLISAGVITLFLVFLWGVNKVATWRRAPKSESPDRGETHPPASPRRRSPVISRPLQTQPRLIDRWAARIVRARPPAKRALGPARGAVAERSPRPGYAAQPRTALRTIPARQKPAQARTDVTTAAGDRPVSAWGSARRTDRSVGAPSQTASPPRTILR